MKILNWATVRILSVALTAMMTNVSFASDHAPISIGGCDSACDVGGFGCSTCDGCIKCSGRRMYLGVEAVFLAPQYSNGAAAFGFEDLMVGPPVVEEIGSSGKQADELFGAPRITLGWIGENGWGIQGRYWETNNSVSAIDFPRFDPVLGNQIQELGGADSFEAMTVDLELTKQLCYRNWEMLGTFGARYADYDHSRTNSVGGVVNGDIFSLGSLQSEAFHGTGLTFSLSGLRPLKRNPNLALFASARGSTLFGDAETTAVAASSVSGILGNAASVNGATDDSSETMFIGELQAGLRWSRCATSFNGRFFAQAAFEYQFWNTSDGNALAYAESGTVGSSLGYAAVRGGKQDLDLVGFNVMTGFAW